MMLSSVPADPRGAQQLPGTASGPCPPLAQLYHDRVATGCRETSKDQRAVDSRHVMIQPHRTAECREGLGMDLGQRHNMAEQRQSTLGSVPSFSHVYGTTTADFRRTERPMSDFQVGY